MGQMQLKLNNSGLKLIMFTINPSTARNVLQHRGFDRLASLKLYLHQHNTVLLLAVITITCNGHLITRATVET